MIYIFRKEMKKWRNLLWIFVAALPLAYVTHVFLRQPLPSEIKVASVDRASIFLNEYQHAVAKTRMMIENFRQYALRQGLPPEIFLSIYNMQDPEKTALEELVKERLLDAIYSDLAIEIDYDYFLQELAKSTPAQFLDQSGRIQEKVYRDFLRRLYVTIDEYEQMKENDLKRELVNQFVQHAFYVPTFLAAELVAKDGGKKSFAIVKVSFDSFLQKAKETAPTPEELKRYYEDNKEVYRVPERRKAMYWTITKQDYLDAMKVDDDTVTLFYEKNKTTRFRIPPELKVRKILLKEDEDAQNILNQARANPETFADLAKKYSQDKESSKRGGLIDFFKRGTYDAAFEKVAFRLQNPQEISDIIETPEGKVIVQLLERKPASSRPLDAVRDEIVTMLQDKKASRKVKSDLESTMYKARTDARALDAFVQEKHFKSQMTDWLTTRNTQGYTKESFLAKRLFEKKKQAANYGYFTHHDDYVLYKELERQETNIPALDIIKDRVLDDYYANKARKTLKEFVKNAKRSLLAGEMTLTAFGEQSKQAVVTTGLLEKGAKAEGIAATPGLVKRAFDLTDAGQVLRYKHKQDYYFVQLTGHEPMDPKEVAAQIQQQALSTKNAQKSRYSSAFIASLVRNATIEHYESSLKNYQI